MSTNTIVRKAIPIVLAIAGSAGVFVTAALAIRETPKAQQILEKKKQEEQKEKLTTAETVKAVWKCYVPAASVGLATAGCIIASSALSITGQASLAAGYALAERSYHQYKSKVKEVLGEEAHEKVVTEIAKEDALEKAGAEYVYLTGGFCGDLKLDFDNEGETKRLFYDVFSKRAFESTLSRVIQAEYFLNRYFAQEGIVPASAWYEYLGIECPPELSAIAWNFDNLVDSFDVVPWLDFNHYKITLDDGLEYCAIEMLFEPEYMDA